MSNTIPETSLSADTFRYVRYQLRGRRGLVVAGTALGGPALWFGWPWLVAAGLAPILIAIAPCAVMCAVGARTMKACGTKNATDASSAPLSRPRHQVCGSLADSDPSVQIGAPIATRQSVTTGAANGQAKQRRRAIDRERKSPPLRRPREVLRLLAFAQNDLMRSSFRHLRCVL